MFLLFTSTCLKVLFHSFISLYVDCFYYLLQRAWKSYSLKFQFNLFLDLIFELIVHLCWTTELIHVWVILQEKSLLVPSLSLLLDYLSLFKYLLSNSLFVHVLSEILLFCYYNNNKKYICQFIMCHCQCFNASSRFKLT